MLVLFFGFSGSEGADRAARQPKSGWSDTIRIDGRTITVEAVSKSGDALEDDMDIRLFQDGMTVPVPVTKGLYEPSSVSSDQDSLAKTLPVFRIGPREILIILTVNRRPGYPDATLVVYDYAARKVVAVREGIARFKQESVHTRYMVLSAGPGSYRMRLISEYLPISDGPEAFIEGWMVIDFDGKSLRHRWQ